jgi:ABC-type microcin C transport system duplicated ATPase subunit YejF
LTGNAGSALSVAGADIFLANGGTTARIEIVNSKLELALAGKSQIIGIVAEAGMGKSRLTAEVIRSARKKGFVGYGGACESSGTNTPYLAWKPIWQAFFDVDPPRQ